MSDIQKCPNLVREGGVSTFFKNVKMSEIQKCPKGRRGGGSTLIGTLSKIFSISYFDASPNPLCPCLGPFNPFLTPV